MGLMLHAPLAALAGPSSLPPPTQDPNRRIINGQHSTVERLHQALADSAQEYLLMQQRAPCSLTGNDTKILFARTDWHGLGNDVNLMVRALQVAVIQQRQLVFLPPTVAERNQFPWLKKLSIPLSAENPWHWLAGAHLPFTSLIVDSECQRRLLEERPGLMQLLADTNESDPTLTLHRRGYKDLARRSRTWRPIWRVGLHLGAIPAPFRGQGLLWWFQALTNYLVRARAPLSGHLDRHPAMRAFLQEQGSFAKACPQRVWDNAKLAPTCMNVPGIVSGAFGRAWCRKRWCDFIGPGWHPPVWFDVGLQLRVGDVCGKHAMMRGQKSRKCSSQPAQDALELMHAHGLQGRLFVASDSHEAVETIVAMGPRYGFNVSSLRFDRGNIEGTAVDAQNHSIGTEMAKRSRTRDLAVLLESMMDVMLLSRSSVLVGSMMSNFPRMALQLRLQAPMGGVHRYLPLDGRTWCTRTSCRMNYSDVFGTVR